MAKENLRLPLLITRGLIVYPSMTESIEAGRDFSLTAVDVSRSETNSLLYVTAQLDPNKETFGKEDLPEYGTLCRIFYFQKNNGSYRIRVNGTKRVKFDSFSFENGTYYATATNIDDVEGDEKEAKALMDACVKVMRSSGLGSSLPKSFFDASDDSLTPSAFADAIATFLPLPLSDKLALLQEGDVIARLKKVKELLEEQIEKNKIDRRIDQKVQASAEKTQKEYFLREKMKAIKDELGEGGGASDVDSIREKLKNNPYPDFVKAKVEKELKRYEMMPEASLESSLIMNYIETLMNVPWYQKTEDIEDLKRAREILDEDHFGLVKVKERIIEYLAVKKSTGTLKAPILCFYGPPGCGKTSLGRSIARALGRKFFKASLGGISDESEIRGHRRTYVGSLPGRIIEGMTKVGVTNPVFLLDEIDKLGGSSYKGDPASAMLEVLDPEQNYAFNDNFLEEPYDLSSVLFICTANYLENIPAPLLDRLELIEVPSYTEFEKMKIASDFLEDKQRIANGLKEGDVEWKEDGIKEILESYTREAGVRQLERCIASVSRKAVVELLEKPDTEKPIVLDREKVKKYLGTEIFSDTKKEKEPQVGVVTGLAYTEFGGDILPIETTYFPGKGGLVLTGKLGDVMKESCEIAVDYVRANAKKYGIKDEIFEKNDIHIHFPEGAVPKDGPSAGCAITTAIVSCLTGIPADNNVAMTGEVSLRGKSLPIGGLREKSLAALRSGIKTIIVPEENQKDIAELPEEVKKDLKIITMKMVDEAIELTLLKKPTPIE